MPKRTSLPSILPPGCTALAIWSMPCFAMSGSIVLSHPSGTSENQGSTTPNQLPSSSIHTRVGVRSSPEMAYAFRCFVRPPDCTVVSPVFTMCASPSGRSAIVPPALTSACASRPMASGTSAIGMKKAGWVTVASPVSSRLFQRA